MSASSPTTPPLNSFGAIWGPPLIGTFVAAVVYGISVLQTFYYYSHHGKSDRRGWLILVGVIFVLDSAAMVLFMYAAYYYSIMSWGIPEMLDPDIKEFPIEYIITTLLAFIVQSFYINTIRALRAPIIITILLFLTSLTAFITGLILPVVQLELVSIMKIVVAPLNHLAFNIARGTALACDLGIVAALCWLFAIRKTEVRRANNILDWLIIFSVQRGVLQAIVQTGEVMSYAIKPDGLYFLPFHVIVSRIYCNSLLATLNSREYVFSKGQPRHTHARRQQVEDKFNDAERGPENVQVEGRQVKDNLFVQPPPVASTPAGEAGATSTRGRWASTLSGTGPVLSSFLEPPFLFTNGGASSSSGGMIGGRSISMTTSWRSGSSPVPATEMTSSNNYSSRVRSIQTRSEVASLPTHPPGITTHNSGNDGHEMRKQHSAPSMESASPVTPEDEVEKYNMSPI